MIKLMIGDCRAKLRDLPDESVHCVVTSPPYWGLRSYIKDGDPLKRFELGLEPTPAEYVANMVEVFREVRRVLRNDGTLWLNLGDSYAQAETRHRNGDSGSTLRDGKIKADEPWSVGTAQVGRRLNYGLKPKDLVGAPWRVAFALQADGWFLRQDIIWCLSGGTRVYAKTQKGEMPMTIKDMVRLDPRTVKLWNGEKWTQVLGWSETPRPDRTFEIELRNGQRIGCTAGHLWPTKRGKIRSDEITIGDVLATCLLPEPMPPKTPVALDDEEIGWFVGLYIAEGSRFDGTIQIASHTKEDERFARLRSLCDALHGSCAVHKTSENGCIVAINGPMLNGVIDTYISGRIASDKHLHPRCWQRSNAFLRAILDGYLAGDGHWDAPNNHWRLGFCNNDELVADLRTIAARLGVTVRLRRTTHIMGDLEFAGYRGELRFARSDHHNNRNDGEVVAIRESRARKFWDVGVEDEPHLFALASGVLTHNSKPNPMPESVTDRCTKAHEYVFLLSKSERYFYDAVAIAEEGSGRMPGNRSYKYDGIHGHETKQGILAQSNIPQMTRNKRSVWEIATQPFSEAHFATMPPALIEPCIKAGTSEKGCCAKCGKPWVRQIERNNVDQRANEVIETSGVPGLRPGTSHDRVRKLSSATYQHVRGKTIGWSPSCTCTAEVIPCTVVDPFAGAGTVGLVADRLQRNAILIELNESYSRMASDRIERDAGLFVAIHGMDKC